MSITISTHARQQAAAKNIPLEAVWQVALNPENTYGSYRKDNDGNRLSYTCRRCGAEQKKWTGTASDGTKLCLAVNTCCGEVVTLWLDQIETALRDDQKAAGVTGYAGRDDRPAARRKPLTAKQKKALKKARHARRGQQ